MAKYIHDHEHHLKLSHKSIPTYMYKLGHHYDWLMLANAAWENISTPVLHKPKTFTTFDIFLSRRKKKKDDSDVATGVKYGVASFSSWSKSICNLEIDFSRIRGLPKTIAFTWRWTPWTGTDTYLPQTQAQATFPHGWLKWSGSSKYPHYDWWVGPQVVGKGAPEIKH